MPGTQVGSSEERQLITETTRRALRLYMAWGLLFSPPLAYVDGLILGVVGQDALWAVAKLLPPLFLALGIVYPYLVLRVLVHRALRCRPEDVPGARLERLLRLPWRAAFLASCGSWILGGSCFSLGVCVWFGRPMWLVPMSTLIGVCCGTVLALPFALTLERQLLPLAVAEQRRHPDVVLSGRRGLSWPRLSWFLPFAFVASLVCVLLLSGCVVAATLADMRGATPDLSKLGPAVAWIGGLVLVLPTLTTWLLARRLAAGVRAVHTAIDDLANGRVRSPGWVSTDELGDLSFRMNKALARLREFPSRLQESARRLQESGGRLHEANSEQGRDLTQQASELREVKRACEELNEASRMAAVRAEEVLREARRGGDLGRAGERAVEQSMAGFTALQEFVGAIKDRLERLQPSARQIGDIAWTVKELANQSNLLALNAAIEAMRSGEQGSGFGVVAGEIRSLAKQSASAVVRIRGILDEVARAIDDAVALGKQGARQVASGLVQMKSSGDCLRELSLSAQKSSETARQIAMAVTQQSAGFAEVLSSISDLSRRMNATLARLAATQDAAGTLESVSGEVAEIARRLDAS